MKSFPVIKPIDKKIFKIEFKDPYLKPAIIETEEQFKELIQNLIVNKRQEEAKELTQQWINLKKEHFKLNYHGKFLNLGVKTAIMGIINVTPDSFSNGSEDYKDINKILKKVEFMLENGADIIDVGGESTKTGELRQFQQMKR
jgi:Dihydropteroate synthase and related enzymes